MIRIPSADSVATLEQSLEVMATYLAGLDESDRREAMLLKIMFVFRDGNLFLKSAYDANEKSQHIYTVRSKEQE